MPIPQLSTMQPWRLKRTTVSNAAYTVLITDVYVAQIGTMSAARIWTLPTAAAFGLGCMLVLADESGTATATFTISVARAASDTINGATSLAVINVAFGKAFLISDGVSKWTRLV